MADFGQHLTGLSWMLTTRLHRAERARLACSCSTLSVSHVTHVSDAYADFLVAMAFATQGLMTVASRIVMSTARDGLYGPVSPHLARVHPRLAVSTMSTRGGRVADKTQVPVWSLIFVAVWIVVFGLICESELVASC